jgi:hypothetical protein
MTLYKRDSDYNTDFPHQSLNNMTLRGSFITILPTLTCLPGQAQAKSRF